MQLARAALPACRAWRHCVPRCARPGSAGSCGCCWRCWCWRCWSPWCGWPAATRPAGAEPARPRHRRRGRRPARGLQRNVQSLQALHSGQPARRSLARGTRARCCASTANGCASNGATRPAPRWPPPTRPTARRVFDAAGPRQAAGRRGAGLRQRRARVSGAGLLAQLLRAAARRPRPGGDGAVPAACDGRAAHRLLVATYSLRDMLTELVGPQLTRSQEVAFTEADGTRLAVHGRRARGSRVFTSQQLIDLPGNTHDAAHRQLARRARPVPQRADGAGHRHVDRAGRRC